MFFALGQRSIAFLLSIYFKKIEIQGVKPVEEGPLIIAGNHPNMALDPLLILASYPRSLHFLAKSSLFSNPVANWFLRACHLIPVYRRTDRSPDQTNDKTFDEVQRLLSNRQAVTIFPEGTSVEGRTVLRLKTGAARMAFLSEERNNWSLGVKIQPVGITYAHFLGWNSGVAIAVGEPIVVDSFRELYERDPIKAVHRLTESLELALKHLSVHVDQSHLAPLINAIHQIFTRSGRISEVDTASLSRIAHAVATLAPLYPEKASEFLSRARMLLSVPISGELPRWFLLALPAIALGNLIHIIPYQVTAHLAGSLSPDEHQRGMYTFFVGTGVFFAWYALLMIVLLVIGAGFWTAFLLAGAGALGVFAGRALPLWRVFLLSLVLPSSVRALNVLQDELIDELLEYAERVGEAGTNGDGVGELIH